MQASAEEMTSESLARLIRNRRAVFPQAYLDIPLTEDEIRSVLESARWAPTHKKTEPWRFIVFQDEGLGKLADWLADQYKEYTEEAGDYSEAREQKTRDKVFKSGCVLGVCMQRDPRERLPEWEEVAAVACAVQNMWLTCSSMGIGSYWSTPQYIIDAPGMPGSEDEWICLGLFYMGKWDRRELPADRLSVGDISRWINS